MEKKVVCIKCLRVCIGRYVLFASFAKFSILAYFNSKAAVVVEVQESALGRLAARPDDASHWAPIYIHLHLHLHLHYHLHFYLYYHIHYHLHFCLHLSFHLHLHTLMTRESLAVPVEGRRALP